MSHTRDFLNKYSNAGDKLLQDKLDGIDAMDISEIKKMDMRQIAIEKFEDGEMQDEEEMIEFEKDTFQTQVIEGWGMGHTLSY